MDLNEFREGVIYRGVFLEKEVNEICKSYVTGKSCTRGYLCTKRDSRYTIKPPASLLTSNIIEFPQYALIRCSVEPISALQGYKYSNTYIWDGYLWCLGVAKENDRGTGLDSLSVYIFLNTLGFSQWI